MEKKGARLFQQSTSERDWNIVELDSRRQLRLKVNKLICMTNDVTLTTTDIRKHLLQNAAAFGKSLAAQLVRSLHRDDYAERQSIIWLLTLLDDPETILPLQQMSRNPHLPRAIRLSASLALAGMGITVEMLEENRRSRLYAIS